MEREGAVAPWSSFVEEQLSTNAKTGEDDTRALVVDRSRLRLVKRAEERRRAAAAAVRQQPRPASPFSLWSPRDEDFAEEQAEFERVQAMMGITSISAPPSQSTSRSPSPHNSTPKCSDVVRRYFPQSNDSGLELEREEVEVQKHHDEEEIRVAREEAAAARDEAQRLKQKIEELERDRKKLLSGERAASRRVHVLETELAGANRSLDQAKRDWEEEREAEWRKIRKQRAQLDRLSAAERVDAPAQREEVRMLREKLAELEAKYSQHKERARAERQRNQVELQRAHDEIAQLREEIHRMEEERLRAWEFQEQVRQQVKTKQQKSASRMDHLNREVYEDAAAITNHERVLCSKRDGILHDVNNHDIAYMQGINHHSEERGDELIRAESNVSDSRRRDPSQRVRGNFTFPKLPDKDRSYVDRVVKPSGKVLTTYADGSKITICTNGTTRYVLPDRLQVHIQYANGDWKWTLPDREVYFHASSVITETHYTNGVKEYHFAGQNQFETHHPDGSREIIFADGLLKRVFVDGMSEVEYPDGKVERFDNDGRICLG